LPLLLLLLISSLSSLSDCREISGISSDADRRILRSDDEAKSAFESWIAEHKKTYGSAAEKQKRFEIFKNKLNYIDERNAIPGRLYKLGLNRFSDLTSEEYRKTFLGYKPSLRRRNSTTVGRRDVYAPAVGKKNLPTSVDWRTKGVVNPIKDQGQCGT
ncbi:cysteine protease, partial [Genlisea aurea]